MRPVPACPSAIWQRASHFEAVQTLILIATQASHRRRKSPSVLFVLWLVFRRGLPISASPRD